MPQSIPSPQPFSATDSAPPQTDDPDPRPPAGEPARHSVADTPPDLPGCVPFPMTVRDFERSHERFEFWDARTETVWMVRDHVTVHHEHPLSRLAVLAGRIASVRGSPIECYGSVSLVRRGASGRYRWAMKADQIVDLDSPRWRQAGRVIDVDEGPLPNVVLEVDHTTDVRRWKLGLYMECGFPELWVSVPHETSVRNPGLTIHLREGDGYVESPESRAFPGWRAEEIHRALTEAPLTTWTWRALERVGRAMGAREGTRPDDDPLTRSLTASAREEGRAEGHAEGHAEGWASGCTAGRLAERVEAVRAVLRARGIEPEVDFAEAPDLLAAPSLETVMAAALACTDEADFRRRLRDPSARPAG